MKKNVLYYALMASILVGCSKGGDEKEGDDSRVPIVLAMGMPDPETTTRGTGTVGGLTDGKWSGQTLTILAFRKGKISQEAADIAEIGSNGILAKTNTEASVSGLTWNNGLTLYYPIQNAYDFYGYYIDDIVSNASITSDANDVPGEVLVPITIDGTQDVMVSKAELTDPQKVILSGSLATDEEKEKEYAKAYSSYTARRGVHPNMLFKHLLTRLTFEVKAGEDKIVSNDLDGVYITSVELVNVENKGIIHISVAEQKLEITPVDAANPVNLSLGIDNQVSAGGITFNGIKPNSITEFVSMGESIMAMPKQKVFKALLKMRQIKNGVIISGANSEAPFGVDIKAPIVKDKDTGEVISDYFVEGYSYRVKLTMFGLEEIEATAEVAPWKQGDDINLTPWE